MQNNSSGSRGSEPLSISTRPPMPIARLFPHLPCARARAISIPRAERRGISSSKNIEIERDDRPLSRESAVLGCLISRLSPLRRAPARSVASSPVFGEISGKIFAWNITASKNRSPTREDSFSTTRWSNSSGIKNSQFDTTFEKKFDTPLRTFKTSKFQRGQF